MPKSANDLFVALQKRLIRLDKTRERVEKLYVAKKIIKFDVEQIYSGLYLDAFVSLERYIEDLFVGYLTGKITPATRLVKPRISFATHQIAIDVLLSGKRYLDWLPYVNTRNRANIFFQNGHPFCGISRPQEGLLEELHKIRNALAHRSEHSFDVFLRFVVGSLPLNPLEKKPSSFLRSTFRANPHQTRFENYLFEMLICARQLSQV
jgi:hypothetical protein